MDHRRSRIAADHAHRQRDRWIALFDTRPKDTHGWLKSELKPPE
jgi:hypothetical protein